MTHELYKKYRPQTLDEIVGQPEAVAVLGGLIEHQKIPHTILFTGPSGCGKTTLARIVAKSLKCGEVDFNEMNAADSRGIDTIREIRNHIGKKPLSGPVRVWIIDECHKLTNDAQTAFLKMLEDTPKHVYFLLATSDPGKLLPTMLNRCTVVKCKAIAPKALENLVKQVAAAEIEEGALTDEVCEKIAELAEGSARKSLVLLGSIIDIEDEEKQLEALERSEHKALSIEIARALLNPRTNWPDMCKIIKGVEDEPESLRRMVLGYATNVMLSGGKMTSRAFLIVQAFRDDFYSSGRAGLVAACYEVINAN